MTTLDSVLDAGLHWLYETEQPDNSHQQHHGITLGLPAANRWYGFSPTGARNLPVVSVNVSKVEYKTDDGDQVPANPLEPGELEALADELRRRRFDVDSTWNGHPAVTGSVGLVRTAHPALLAAVGRYRRGCPEHPQRGVFCDCEAWQAEATRIIAPLTTSVAAST